jgi:hypothetical protein
MRFRDLIAAVKASMRYGPLICFIGESGIEFRESVNNCITHREIAICDFPIRQIACGPLWRTGGRWRKASSENRESEFGESHEQVHQKSRNRDMRFPDKANSVWATLEDRWQVKGPSEDQRIGNRQIGIPVNEGSGNP